MALSGIEAMNLGAAAGEPADRKYRVLAKGKSEAEIYLYGEVGDELFGGVSSARFAEDLVALGNVDKIDLRIDSVGGDVWQGMAIYRLLADHPARVVAHVDGIAASISSAIAMAASEITIGEASMMMIHEPWARATGGEEKMLKTAALLRKMTGTIRDVYVARTGNSATDVKAWMAAETWFSADEAVVHGFADAISGNIRLAAAAVDPKRFPYMNTPAALIAKPNLAALRDRVAKMKAKYGGREAA